jgi:hypothetical protein
VRVYRFRAPRWRRYEPLFHEDIELGPFLPFELILALVSALFATFFLPLLSVLIETPADALRGLVSNTRWIEAKAPELRRSRLTWRTDSRHAAAVAEQVARQLELGYTRVEPHNAVFEGFDDP